jgi:CelD/BcsL family acetyltransferase involved in cellulose biosynthesis
VARDSSGAALGILPLMALPHSWCQPRELRYLSDYRASGAGHVHFLVSPEAASAALESLGAQVASMEGWDRLRLSRLRTDHETVWEFCRVAAAHDLRTEVRPQPWARYAVLPDSFEKYLAGLTSHRRKHLRHALRRLEAEHTVSLDLPADETEVQETVAWYVARKRERMRQRGEWTWVSQPVYAAFLRGYAAAAWRRGRLRLFRLKLDGAVAACALVLTAGRVATFYGHAYDIACPAARISEVLRMKALEACLREGFEIADLMQAEHAHKRHDAQQRLLVVKLDLYRPEARSLLFEGLTHLAAPAWQAARSMLPHRLVGQASRFLRREKAPTAGRWDQK